MDFFKQIAIRINNLFNKKKHFEGLEKISKYYQNVGKNPPKINRKIK